MEALRVILLVFFATHIPATLLVDSQAVLPPRLVPPFAADLLAWHVRRTSDPVMTAPFPPWFRALVLGELAFQVRSHRAHRACQRCVLTPSRLLRPPASCRFSLWPPTRSHAGETGSAYQHWCMASTPPPRCCPSCWRFTSPQQCPPPPLGRSCCCSTRRTCFCLPPAPCGWRSAPSRLDNRGSHGSASEAAIATVTWIATQIALPSLIVSCDRTLLRIQHDRCRPAWECSRRQRTG